MAFEKLLVKFGAFLLTCSVIVISAQDDCKPLCQGVMDNGRVADPFNCSNYYVCQHSKAEADPEFCGQGFEFTEDKGACVTASQTPCRPKCYVGGGSGICHLTCEIDNDLINDPFDCSVYYQCTLGGKIPNKCPVDRPYFSIIGCSTDASLCCIPGCTPICEKNNTVIADPNDCTKWFECNEPGIPSESSKHPCPSGSYFDVAIGKCSSLAACQILCPDAPTPSTDAANSVTQCYTAQTPPATGSTDVGSTVQSTATTDSPTDISTGASTQTPIPTQPTTVETTTMADCTETFTCPAPGYFPKCQSCKPEYFRCEAAGAQGVENRCVAELVFNTHPAYPYCIKLEDCPMVP